MRLNLPFSHRDVLSAVAGSTAALLAAPAAVSATHHGPGAYYAPTTQWNGYKVFLSPAHHFAGDNAGCYGYVEDSNMRNAAYAVANVTSAGLGGLRARGYYVKIGDSFPDDNVAVSNTYGYHVYLALHSSGSTQNGATCSGTVHRIEALYKNGNVTSENLALAQLGSLTGDPSGSGQAYAPSPGSQHKKVPRDDVYELNNASTSRRALNEHDFHDNVSGWSYAKSYNSYAWRVARGVDQHLNYP